MFRSMTSDVSALSSIVANGHQTVHSFLPTSKIPYGGFSPVQLQCLRGFLEDAYVQQIVNACRESSAVQGILVEIHPRCWLGALANLSIQLTPQKDLKRP